MIILDAKNMIRAYAKEKLLDSMSLDFKEKIVGPHFSIIDAHINAEPEGGCHGHEYDEYCYCNPAYIEYTIRIVFSVPPRTRAVHPYSKTYEGHFCRNLPVYFHSFQEALELIIEANTEP